MKPPKGPKPIADTPVPQRRPGNPLPENKKEYYLDERPPVQGQVQEQAKGHTRRQK